MKNLLRPALVAAMAFALPITAAAQAPQENLQLTMQDGRVTIVAQNVPLRQILAEWARVGQTKIINGEKLSGPAMTLQLVNKSEREALEIAAEAPRGLPRQVSRGAVFLRARRHCQPHHELQRAHAG